MLGALQSTFRESVLTRKGGDALRGQNLPHLAPSLVRKSQPTTGTFGRLLVLAGSVNDPPTKCMGSQYYLRKGLVLSGSPWFVTSV